MTRYCWQLLAGGLAMGLGALVVCADDKTQPLNAPVCPQVNCPSGSTSTGICPTMPICPCSNGGALPPQDPPAPVVVETFLRFDAEANVTVSSTSVPVANVEARFPSTPSVPTPGTPVVGTTVTMLMATAPVAHPLPVSEERSQEFTVNSLNAPAAADVVVPVPQTNVPPPVVNPAPVLVPTPEVKEPVPTIPVAMQSTTQANPVAVPPPAPIGVVPPPVPMTAPISPIPVVTTPMPIAQTVALVPVSRVEMPYKLSVRMGSGVAKFEIRSGDDIVLKGQCDRIDVKAPAEGMPQTMSGLHAVGNVKIAGPGVEGTCESLHIVSATGEVRLHGSVHLKCKKGKVCSEIISESMIYHLATSSVSGLTTR